MGIPINVLIIEDEEDHALLILHELKSGGYEPSLERVDTPEAMNAALDRKKWDVVISDYVMPRFSGLDALLLLKKRNIDIPFIIISGKIIEEIAIEAMRLGAHDYIMKDNLSRLVPAVGRELYEAEIRQKRRQIEESLKKSEERYRKLVEAITDYIYTVRVENGRPVETRHGYGCVAVTGYTTEEYNADPFLWINMVYGEDRDKVREQAERVLRGEAVRPLEHRVFHKNGSIIWVRNTPVPQYDERGNLISYDGLISDITERKYAEESLQRTTELLEKIFSNTSFCFSYMDSKFNFIRVNRAYAEINEQTPEFFIGKNHFDLYPHKENEAIFKKVVETGETYFAYEKPFEFPEHPEWGTTYWDWSLQAVKAPDGKVAGVVLSLIDVTKRKRIELENIKLEAQLRQAQKMEAVGQLAGGVAHDFNNILTTIMGYGDFLKEDVPKDSPLKIYIDQILTAADKAANLTRSLLAFSRKQVISPKAVNINEIIRKMEKLLFRLIGEDIELRTCLVGRDLVIMADSGQIEQVLMNLCANARDAMPDGGLLTISTGTIEIDDSFIKDHGFGVAGMYAVTSIADTGRGMDEKTRERIFEPFFTTKESGKGTGLGLSIVYGIIKQHNGYINCYSEIGRGTTFKIYLPIVTSDIEEAKLADITPLKGGTETILVAEDDAEVRKIIKDVLERFGYRIVEAVDGEDAVKVFKEGKDSFQLLILDVIMPKKNGKEVYEEVKKIRPDMKALFTSGYTADIIYRKGILEKGLSFISKPVSQGELLRKVREILDG